MSAAGQIIAEVFPPREAQTVPAQSKLTPSESEMLDEFVAYARARGVLGATRASAVRGLINRGLRKYGPECGLI
jgi:hypothetical protein